MIFAEAEVAFDDENLFARRMIMRQVSRAGFKLQKKSRGLVSPFYRIVKL